MRQLATGVTVITTISPDGKKEGVTINTFTSLSLDPLLVLFCLKKKSFCYDEFLHCKYFTANLLSASQQQISDQFTKSSEEKWQHVILSKHAVTPSPAIDGTIAFLECETHKFYDGGDHTIIVGKVINSVDMHHVHQPLIYFSGQYFNT